MLRGLAWTPDGTQVSFLDAKRFGAEGAAEAGVENERHCKQKKENNAALWIVDATSGERRMLLSGERLASMLPENSFSPSQATGLGRHAPADYQWAPDGTALLFQGPNALVWFVLKSKEPRTLVSGKATLADPKISPDGKFVSFVRDHNLWLINIADGKEQAITRDGVEEIRKGELDWVYPEELDIKTAYWWAPDSSAIVYLEMDERKVALYPLVDFASFNGKVEMERYPPVGGANPVVHVFVAAVSGAQTKQMDTGSETDQYIPRVNLLPDSKQVAIQGLNWAQTSVA